MDTLGSTYCARVEMSRSDHLGMDKLYTSSSMGETDSPFLRSCLPLALHLELGTCGTFLCTLACQLVLPLCLAMNHSKDQAARISPNGIILALLCNLQSLVTAILAQAQGLYQWDPGLALAGQEPCPGFLGEDKINGRGCAVSPRPPETLPGSLPRSLPCFGAG